MGLCGFANVILTKGLRDKYRQYNTFQLLPVKTSYICSSVRLQCGRGIAGLSHLWLLDAFTRRGLLPFWAHWYLFSGAKSSQGEALRA